MDINSILKERYNDPVEEMRDLVLYLNEATKAYDAGDPVITDRRWDDRYYRLCLLECQTGIILPESPTHFIKFEVKSELDKITHDHLMLSLDKTKEVDAIKSFLGNREWVAMSKLDGLTCSLTYDNGELVRAETRGNGEVGEDITHNMKVNLSIPQKIPYSQKVTIDGEIICTYQDFERYKDEYKNPRNFASGSIRLLDSWECRRRNLTFVAWDVITPIQMPHYITNPNTLIHQLGAVEDWGFRTPAVDWNALGSKCTVEEAIEHIKNDSKTLGYPIDGVVFKFNNLSLRESLGSTAHHFNNAIAYKFFDELYDTRLKDIEWTMGRTGVLTPVVVFNPVDADGSIIERASLHNISVMEDLIGSHPYIGEEIQVYKSNMIIPQVYKGEYLNRDEDYIHIPNKCPVCGGDVLIKDNDGVKTLICTNLACDGKLINKLDHYLGKKGIDAKGISKATLEKLIDWGWIGNLTEIYSLKNFKEEWINKSGFGIKSVDKILDSIDEASKNLPWEKFLCSLGIPLIGSNVCKDLSNVFHSWDEFRQAVIDGYKFYDLPNFGLEKHNSIIKFNFEDADYLVKYHCVEFAAPASTIVETPAAQSLSGKVFVITGSLKTYKNRAELQSKIESLGGKVTNSVSKNTSYLINNDITSTSSKNITANKLSIPIISEADFNEMIN